MENNFTARELALYLARRKGDYVYGIPVQAQSTSKASVKPGFVFVFAEDSAENSQFLQALIEKGLKADIADHKFLPISQTPEIVDQISLLQKLKTYELRKIVLFGSDLIEKFKFSSQDENASPFLKFQDFKVLRTAEISKLVNDQALKKVFWNNLRSL